MKIGVVLKIFAIFANVDFNLKKLPPFPSPPHHPGSPPSQVALPIELPIGLPIGGPDRLGYTYSSKQTKVKIQK